MSVEIITQTVLLYKGWRDARLKWIQKGVKQGQTERAKRWTKECNRKDWRETLSEKRSRKGEKFKEKIKKRREREQIG